MEGAKDVNQSAVLWTMTVKRDKLIENSWEIKERKKKKNEQTKLTAILRTVKRSC